MVRPLALRRYYAIKPYLPLRLRLFMRRQLARRIRARNANRWPILEFAGLAPRGWPGWPEDRAFAFVLTHDVESMRGLERVEQLAQLEMSLGFRSCFNFIPEGPYRVNRELREWLVRQGFEVGVHDYRHDGKLFLCESNFRQGAERINYHIEEWNAAGFRAGFMFHNLEWIKNLNIQYDSSTFDTDPFEPQPDGVESIFPFWVDRRDGCGYVELPCTLVQDSTLFVMLQEKSNEIWKRKLEWISQHGGMALLNVHPDYMTFNATESSSDQIPVRHYAEFLSWVKYKYSGRYWHALPQDVASFWRNHSHAGVAEQSGQLEARSA